MKKTSILQPLAFLAILSFTLFSCEKEAINNETPVQNLEQSISESTNRVLSAEIDNQNLKIEEKIEYITLSLEDEKALLEELSKLKNISKDPENPIYIENGSRNAPNTGHPTVVNFNPPKHPAIMMYINALGGPDWYAQHIGRSEVIRTSGGRWIHRLVVPNWM